MRVEQIEAQPDDSQLEAAVAADAESAVQADAVIDQDFAAVEMVDQAQPSDDDSEEVDVVPDVLTA